MKTLYVSDLDGTLINSDGKTSKQTVAIINELITKGMNFTFATARSIASATGLVEDFNLTIPAVMMNGVFLTDIANKTHRHVNVLPPDIAKRVVELFNTFGRPPFLFSLNTADGVIEAEYTVLKSDYEQSFAKRRQSLYRRFEQVEDYSFNRDIVYISGIDFKDVMDPIANELKGMRGISFSHYLDTYSGDKYFVEVYSERAGKWNAILRLKEMYGFDRVVAFGDNANDVEMLKNADVGIAVGNAQPEAMAAADIVIDTNDNDGVVKYLYDIFNKGEL